MSDVFVMEPGLDYEVIDPDQGRQIGYFRDNLYFEGDFSRPVGVMLDDRFHIGGHVVGRLVGMQIVLGDEMPYTLALRLAV